MLSSILPHPRVRAPRRRLRLAPGALLACLLASCAGLDQERHIAPLFTEVSLAGGDIGIEALGGVIQVERDRDTEEVEYWAIRPLVSWRRVDEARTFSWFLPPLGTRRTSTEEDVTQLLPVFRYARKREPGQPDSWTVLTLPGIYWSKNNEGQVRRAWFPFGGVVEHFFSYDRAEFVLLPLWMRTQRHGRTTHHVLFPIFSFSSGAGGSAWRAWPLASHNRWEGRYDRWSVLWPFFHFQRNDLARPEEFHQTSWAVWPFVHRATRANSSNTSWLWPFFGWAEDRRTGFWSWDGPWPLVLFQGVDESAPEPEPRATRYRVWPFYSYYKGDGLTSQWHPWPLFNRRVEESPDATKRTAYLFPFWHGWDRVGKDDALVAKWRKLWPLGRYYNDPRTEEELFAFPALNPFWRLDFVDEHYAWLWELWTRTRRFDHVSERSWLGLWRREKDRDEDRRSFVGVWARRDYSLDGKPAVERSVLFGLIRWRTTEDGRSMLPPAFPGPGWPLKRTPSTLPSLESAPALAED